MTKRITTRGVAAQIEAEFPELRVHTYPWTSSTDTTVAGTRFRREGQGRRGTRLEIFYRDAPHAPHIYRFTSSETYRHVAEVIEWIERYRQCKRGKHRKFFVYSKTPADCEICKRARVA